MHLNHLWAPILSPSHEERNLPPPPAEFAWLHTALVCGQELRGIMVFPVLVGYYGGRLSTNSWL
jgi:hypothetical protein